jgi:hypothetical protein
VRKRSFTEGEVARRKLRLLDGKRADLRGDYQ